MTARSDEAQGYVAPAALYIHVPICASKCSYCDFFSVPASALAEGFEGELVGAILARAESLAARFGAEAFETVYIGGGTPSLLSLEGLDTLLCGVSVLSRGPGARPPREWTVEANPDSIGPEALALMRERGVTRLSLGVQSLDPDELALLGRRHGPSAALNAVRLASEAGLAVSADLLAGIPSSLEKLRSAPSGKLAGYARELLDAGATHISVYDLTIEEGTPMAAARRRYSFPGEDEDWEARRKLESILRDAGLRRYEVSNYAAVGNECRHNLAYWHMDSYLGAGPGAVSTIAGRRGTALRIEEAKDVSGYRGRAGTEAVETLIGLGDSVFESIMMAFRTSFGLDAEAFRRRFGLEATDLLDGSLASWRQRIVAGEPWPGRDTSLGPALDGRGLDLLNRFLVDCLEEIERKLQDKTLKKSLEP